jgi:hypothetical protein
MNDRLPHTVGTATRHEARVLTDGRLRWSVDPITGGLTARDQSEPSTTLYPQVFFRESGTRWQMCVLFPSGATQILATEP